MDNNEYRQFINVIELKDIFLSDLRSKRNNFTLEEGQDNIEVDFSHEFSLEQVLKTQFVSLARFSIIAKNLEDTLFEISCQYTIINELDNIELMKEELLKKFVDSNLSIIVWPYAREIINSLTTRMGFPPLILNTIRI